MNGSRLGEVGNLKAQMMNKEQKPKACKTDVSSSFSTVVSMVEDGWDISKALAKLCICRRTFYRHLTKEQKYELDMAKTLNTKYGVGSRGCSNNCH